MSAGQARGGGARRVRTGAGTALAACALAALLGAAAPASGGLFDDEEARKRIDETNVRIVDLQKRVDERMNSLETQLKSQGLLELFGAVEMLKADIARLRGQIEVLTHELAEAQKRQRDLYVDLDSRMRRTEAAQAQLQAQMQAQSQGQSQAQPQSQGQAQPQAQPPATSAVAGAPGSPAPVSVPPAGSAAGGAAPGGSAPGGAAPGPASPSTVAAAPVAGAASDLAAEQRTYDAALEQFKRGDYPGAIAAFGAFVKAHARSPLAPSAQYWIGNAQYARKDFRAAIASQRSLIQQYPDSAKVPDAMLNIASAQAELNDNAAARRTLEELIARHPASEASTKARQRLGVR